MNGIAVFEAGTDERKALELAAAMLTFLSPNRKQYYVGETLFDAGQDWMWTTVLCIDKGPWGSYQAFTPRDQEEVLKARNVEEMRYFADKYFAGKWSNDTGEVYIPNIA